MDKSIIIVGMGPGLSMGVAEKFGSEGYAIGMISRNAAKLQGIKEQLAQQGIKAEFATADASDTQQLEQALNTLTQALGEVHVLNYNAVDARMKPIMEESVDDLTKGFRISVGNALAAARFMLPELKKHKGAILLTGGGTATHPNPDMATISLGKAGIRNLAYQLHPVLREEGVFVGTVTIGGWIHAGSEKHSPKILGEVFWDLYRKQDKVEVVH